MDQKLVDKLKAAGFPVPIDLYSKDNSRMVWKDRIDIADLKEWIKSHGSGSLKKEVSEFLQDFENRRL